MKDKVAHLIEEAVAENPDLFLVDWSITPAHQIEVLVDGDNGLPIEEVVRISRHVEHNLDREEADFSLTVSSPGINRPLELPRQFIKNLNRKIKLNTLENVEIKGTIVAADEDKVTLSWKTREPKPIGKGKHTVEKTQEIPYAEIKKAVIQIDF